MLSVFNNPSQLGIWIVWSKVSQEGRYMYHFDFFPMKLDRETKKQTENLLILQCKKQTRNGKSQVFKKIIGFV